MIHGIKPEKKSISRVHASRQLKITLEEFTELSLLLNIKPYQFKNKHRLDHEDKLQYRFEDIQRMIDSDAYNTIMTRNKVLERRREYVKKKRVLGLNKLQDVEYEYGKLVKMRCPGLKDAVVELSGVLDMLFV
ncbi:hypothetical protein COBT_003349, partial [Conglomerata obtusa]